MPPPWETDGVLVPAAYGTIAQALINAGLGWSVEASSLFTDHGGIAVQVPNLKALTRDDTYGFICMDSSPSCRKVLVSQINALAFLDDLQRALIGQVERVGQINGGKTVWAMFRLNSVEVAGEWFTPCLMAFHDNTRGGSGSVQLWYVDASGSAAIPAHCPHLSVVNKGNPVEAEAVIKFIERGLCWLADVSSKLSEPSQFRNGSAYMAFVNDHYAMMIGGETLWDVVVGGCRKMDWEVGRGDPSKKMSKTFLGSMKNEKIRMIKEALSLI